MTRRTSPTSIVRTGRQFQPDKLPVEARGLQVVAVREPERTGTAGVGVAADGVQAAAAVAAEAGKASDPR